MAPENVALERVRMESLPEHMYEAITVEQLVIAALSDLTEDEVRQTGVQSNLVALHLQGNVPEGRQDLHRLAQGLTMIRPPADHPPADAAATGPAAIDAALGINVRNGAEEPASASAGMLGTEPNDSVPAPTPSEPNAAANAVPWEARRLMNETMVQHRLSRHGPVIVQVSAALTAMDCGVELTRVLENHRVERPDTISQRAWSRKQTREIERAHTRIQLCETLDQLVNYAATLLSPDNLEAFLFLNLSERDPEEPLFLPNHLVESTVHPEEDHPPLPASLDALVLEYETQQHDKHLEELLKNDFGIILGGGTRESKKRSADPGPQLPQPPQGSNPFQGAPVSPASPSQQPFERVLEMLTASVLQSAENSQQMKETLEALTRRTLNESGSTQSGMWSRVISKPDVFKPKDREEELSQFSEWSWQFKQYVRVICPGMHKLLESVESDLDDSNVHSEMSVETVDLSKQLYALLASLLRERPVQILKAIPDGNGCEVWRTLVRTLAPSNKARSLALLGAISQFPAMTNSNYHEQICTTLPPAGDGAVPMDVDMVKGKVGKDKGKGGWKHYNNNPKGKDNKGKGKDYSQYYQKGKHGKGKGGYKGKDHKGKGKGYNHDNSKGKSKGKTNVPYNNCKICGKPGHWSNECWMKKVNQVNNNPGTPNVPQPPAAPGGSTSTTATTATVKRVFNLADDIDAVQFPVAGDLVGGFEESWDDEEWSEWWCYHVTASECEYYDMSTEDSSEENWTYDDTAVSVFDMTMSDALPGDEDWVQCDWAKTYVQMVQQGPSEGWTSEGIKVEVVLDSGADVSVMPEQWLQMDVGQNAPGERVLMRDAQGREMPNLGTRNVSLDLGQAVLHERFHASSVATPLLSLGRLLRKGWSLNHRNNMLCLCFEDVAVPVSFRRNSLVVEATVHNVEASDMSPIIEEVVEEPSSPLEVRPLLEGRRHYATFDFNPDALSTSEAGELDPRGRRWLFLPTGDPVCLSVGLNFVDPSAMMNTALWKFRTTVVKIAERWEVLELHQDLTSMPTMSGALSALDDSLPGVMYESLTMTVMHRTIVEPEKFGFHVEPEAPNPLLDEPLPQVPPEPIRADEGMPDGANDSNAEDEQPGAQPVLPGVQLEKPITDEIDVEGKRLTAESPAAELKLACRALGIGATGSKNVLYKRLVKHVWRRKMEDDLALFEAAKLPERNPRSSPVPTEPSPEEVAKHRLTHVPYQPWCPLCVATRGRRDAHRGDEAHRSTGGWPVLCMDLMYASLEGSVCEFMKQAPTSKEKKLTVLVCVDRDTGMIHSVPLPGKGTTVLQHAAKEVLGFLSYLGRTEVEIRGDNEPPMVALCDKVVEARNKAGLSTRKTPSQPYEHQTNGAAEQAVLSMRDIGSTLLQQVEQNGFAPSLNPELIPWAYVHASTLHNCFSVSAGTTPSERAFQVKYNGRLAMWGETMLFAISEPHRRKGRPKFAKGVFLGKTMLNDLNICGTALGVYLSSTVKRLPEVQQWDKVLLKEVQGKPWRYGLSSMGMKIVPGLRERKPRPEPMAELPVPLHPLPLPGGSSPREEAASDPTSEPASPDAESASESSSEHPGGDVRGAKRSREPGGDDDDSSPQSFPSDLLSPATEPAPMVVEERGEKRDVPESAGSDQSVKKVRAVRVGDVDYFVADEEMEDWWQGLEFDAQYYDDDWMDFTPETDPEVFWEDQGEEEGPPVLSADQLEKVEATSRLDEKSRLIDMGVLEKVEIDPPADKTLQCRLDNEVYRVWKCLPGQQLAPVYWHDELSGDLQTCGLTGNVACPVVYGGKDQAATVHVDDGLLGGFEDQVDQTVGALKEKYKLECSPPLKEVGDQLRFLKRTLEVVPEGLRIVIDPKYVEKILQVLGISKPRSRKVPSTTDLTALDETEKLDAMWAGRYRAALGCLLYLAPDRPDAQYTIGVLARGMSSPTAKQLSHVMYLAEYLYYTRDYSLVLRWSSPGRSYLDESPRVRPRLDDGGEPVPPGGTLEAKPRLLEAVSDADAVDLAARLDSSSARSLLTKAGVSRIRHLDVRLLWTQSLVREKVLSVRPVGTLVNTSDLGTKVLTSKRVKYLLYLLGMYNTDGLITPGKFPKPAGSDKSQAAEILRVLTAAIALSRATASDPEPKCNVPAEPYGAVGGFLTVLTEPLFYMFMFAVSVVAIVVFMAPKRRWNRIRCVDPDVGGDGEGEKAVREPSPETNYFDDSWLIAASDDDEGGATEAYVQSFVYEPEPRGQTPDLPGPSTGPHEHVREGEHSARDLRVDQGVRQQRAQGHDPWAQGVSSQGPAPMPVRTEPAMPTGRGGGHPPVPGPMTFRIGSGRAVHRASCGMVKRAQRLEPEKLIQLSIADALNAGLKKCGHTQTERFRLADCEDWNEPEKLRELRDCVLEWFVELQTTKPITPSLSHQSFCKRQRDAQDRHRSQLAELDSASAIVSYGCKLLDREPDLLQVFVWCAVTILGEAKASSTAGSAGRKETVVLQGDEVRSATCAAESAPVFKKLRRSREVIDLD
ncbi:RE2 [Symbiodinium sp. CCMP2592]|nr:RE2 [Symbiodinium sp. CCMP2592]